MVTLEATEREEFPVPKGFELVDGELTETNVGVRSGWVALRLSHLMEMHREATKCGWVFPAETAYRCFKSKKMVRKPDVSFIRIGQLSGEVLPDGEFKIPPDLAVEVISPHDLATEIDDKVEDYLSAGVLLVWVINPKTRVAIVYRADNTMAKVREGQELDGENVVPGFRCPLSACLPPPGHESNGEKDK